MVKENNSSEIIEESDTSLTEEQKKLLDLFRPIYEHLHKEFGKENLASVKQTVPSLQRKKHSKEDIEVEEKNLLCKRKLAFFVCSISSFLFSHSLIFKSGSNQIALQKGTGYHTRQ